MALYKEQKDNVDFKHPDYLLSAEQVKYVKDIFDGIDTAKKYVKQAPRENDESYITRRDAATLKNFVKRAAEAFVGMIFRKPIDTVGFGKSVSAVFKNVDTKNTINKFSRDLTTTLIRDGKCFIAADTPIGGGNPYLAIIERNSVINWRKDSTGKYTMVVVYEVIEQPSGEFGIEVVEQWRVYKEDGNVDIYSKNANGEYGLVKTIDTEYDYIPIVALDISELPPLYDIAKLTVKHMNRTSFKDKYLDMAAIPIPVIWGADENNGDGTKPVFVIGVDEAFVFTGSKQEGDFEWRELSGSSIKALQDDLSVIEEDITSGVIRAATSDNATVKTATQAFYEAAESSNRVTVIANVVEIALNKAVIMLADMANEPMPETARVIVNQDFNAITSANDDLRLLWEIYMGGALSIETFLNSLDSYEVVDIGSVEDELKRIGQDNFTPEPKNMSEESKTAIDNKMLSVKSSAEQM
jgi:hypothetical protein